MKYERRKKADAEVQANAIQNCFISPNEANVNLEPANVVDGLFAIARALRRLADVIEKREKEQA